MKTKLTRILVAALALVLVLAFVLGAVGSIQPNEAKTARKAMEKVDKDYSAVVATYDGGEVTVGEMMNDFNYAYSETYYMYAYYFGMDLTESDIRAIAESTMKDYVQGEIVAARFDQEHSLSQEDISELDGIVKDEYESNFENALNNVDGSDDEAKRANAELLLKQNGMDEASLRASYTNYYKRHNMYEILSAEVTEVSDEEVQMAYDECVEANKTNYVNGSSFESDMTDESAVICWKPEGYRTVKHILVIPDDEKQTAYQEAVYALQEKETELEGLYSEAQLDSADQSRTPDEIQADIEACEAAIADCKAAVEEKGAACLEDVKAQTDEIYARLEGGEAFESLIAEYGEDPGMKAGITAERGYAVAENSVMWEPNFRDAAMALENAGDYTVEPVLSGSGVHIIRYEADVTPGEVGLENARGELYDVALELAQQSHADDVIAQWVEAAKPAYDVDKFMNVVYG